MNSESGRDANPGPSTESEQQFSGPPQRAPGPDNCPISPSEEAEEPSQERSPEFWMSPERTTLYFGDWVLAKTSKHAKPWPARIEFVNGDLCPTRRQHRLPHMGTVPYDLDFKWPVFFYGTHNVAWVSDRNLKRMIKEENPIPEFDPKLQFGTRFERAVFEFYATPWVGLEEWSDPEPRWEDSVKDFKKKIQSPRLIGWAKQIPPHDKFIPEHWKNHIRVESETGEQPDEDGDPVQVKYQEAIFKLIDMEPGDIIGAVYPDHNNDMDFFIGNESKYID
ncbi:Oidioi.mRNA.OKI2018_I69.XSR.g13545.t1.cds [Oikopleura dioica]|uniref:Oidioi.mRNA.OKI2018_I69.XSR.g13545.t1.cds n=1 Tax=Oikopleura dioica TaxID=34765 RepID=A0ABN7SB18_OIKDI|nr:Oidioi.mRNA.OKI2018_I69.XSR.g13545.t1.cds [Oikopleura dioica]